MGYESETLPLYNELRNRSYYIMLNYTDSLSTTQIHLPRPDTTISSYGSSPSSPPPQYIVHKWGGIPPVLLCLPDVSECTPVWGVIPRLLVPSPPVDIPNPLTPHVSLSYPWYVWPTNGETPTRPSTYPPSPPNYHCRTSALIVPLTYTPSHGPVPFLLYWYCYRQD